MRMCIGSWYLVIVGWCGFSLHRRLPFSVLSIVSFRISLFILSHFSSVFKVVLKMFSILVHFFFLKWRTTWEKDWIEPILFLYWCLWLYLQQVVQECKEIYENSLVDGRPPKTGFVFGRVKCLSASKGGSIWRKLTWVENFSSWNAKNSEMYPVFFLICTQPLKLGHLSYYFVFLNGSFHFICINKWCRFHVIFVATL